MFVYVPGRLRAQKEEELAELEAFRLAAEQAAAAAAQANPEASTSGASALGPAPAPIKVCAAVLMLAWLCAVVLLQPHSVIQQCIPLQKSVSKPALPVKPIIKAVIKPKTTISSSQVPGEGQQPQHQQRQEEGQTASRSHANEDKPASKRQKVEQDAAGVDDEDDGGAGLGALLGGYASDDDG